MQGKKSPGIGREWLFRDTHDGVSGLDFDYHSCAALFVVSCKDKQLRNVMVSDGDGSQIESYYIPY